MLEIIILRWAINSKAGWEEKWGQEGLLRLEDYEEFVSLGLVMSPNKAWL